jgi:hypothetical protein
MPFQIQPIICTAAQVYAYCGISTTQATSTIASGITWATWITEIINSTAWMIVNEINRDYTSGQVNTLNFYGNGKTYITTENIPFATLISCYSSDPNDPKTAPLNEGTNFGTIPGYTFYIGRTDDQIFYPYRFYTLIFAQDSDPRYGTWPISIQQIQLEMIQIIIKESANDAGMLNALERESNIGRPIKFDKDVWQKIKRELRPYKIFP